MQARRVIHPNTRSPANVSTTVVPPSYYVVKARGLTTRVFVTLAQAATAIVQLAPTPATLNVITGRRTRRLTDSELREFGECVRACAGTREQQVQAIRSRHDEHLRPRRPGQRQPGSSGRPDAIRIHDTGHPDADR